MPRSRDGSGGSAAGSQTPKSPPARSSVVHRRRNKVKSYHFRGHTPGWLLLAFGQFTFCASEMTLLAKFRPTIIGSPENHFYGFLGEEEQRRKRAFGFTRIRVIRSLRRRHRGENFVQPNSKKWLCHFFDRLRQKGKPRRASPFDCFVRRKEWKIESQRLFARRPVRAVAGQLVNFLTFC